MKKRFARTSAVAAAAGIPLVAVLTAHSALAGTDPSTTVVGGGPVTNPAVVQLEIKQGGGTAGCTGELIASQWVLTAKHCTEGASSMNVYFSNSTTNRGAPIASDDMMASDSGDVALVHLASAAPVQQYLSLSDGYDPKANDTAVIEGYGLGPNKQRNPSLYGANVTVLGASTDAFGGAAIHVKGNDGASNHGDSGGPILINGKIAGVCSTGDTSDPGADIHATSNYADIDDSRDWIRQTAGV